MWRQADGPESDEDESGVDTEEHDHTDPESDFFCDATGQTLRLGTQRSVPPKHAFLWRRAQGGFRSGAWWHRVGQSYDLCSAEYRKLPPGTARTGFVLIQRLSDLYAPPRFPFPLAVLPKPKDDDGVWLQGSGPPSIRHGAARCRPGRQQAPISRGGRPPREGTDTSLPSLATRIVS